MFIRQLKLLVLLLLPFSSLVLADGGILNKVVGDVQIDGYEVVSGDYFDAGTVVTTGENSSVVMEYDDGQITVLSANSELLIEDYDYDEVNPENSKSVLNLVSGGMQFLSGKISKARPESVNIKTPSATIGIRGTVFNVVVYGLGNTATTTTQVLSGAVATTSGSATLTLAAGQIGIVANGAVSVVSLSSLPAAVQATLTSISSQAAAAGVTGGVTLSSAGSVTGSAAGGSAGAGAGAAGGAAGAGGAAAGGAAAAAGAGIGGIAGASVAAAAAALAGASVAVDNSDDAEAASATATTSTTGTN